MHDTTALIQRLYKNFDIFVHRKDTLDNNLKILVSEENSYLYIIEITDKHITIAVSHVVNENMDKRRARTISRLIYDKQKKDYRFGVNSDEYGLKTLIDILKNLEFANAI